MLQAGRPAADVARVFRVHRATVGRLAAAERLAGRGGDREAAGKRQAAAASRLLGRGGIISTRALQDA